MKSATILSVLKLWYITSYRSIHSHTISTNTFSSSSSRIGVITSTKIKDMLLRNDATLPSTKISTNNALLALHHHRQNRNMEEEQDTNSTYGEYKKENKNNDKEDKNNDKEDKNKKNSEEEEEQIVDITFEVVDGATNTVGPTSVEVVEENKNDKNDKNNDTESSSVPTISPTTGNTTTENTATNSNSTSDTIPNNETSTTIVTEDKNNVSSTITNTTKSQQSNSNTTTSSSIIVFFSILPSFPQNAFTPASLISGKSKEIAEALVAFSTKALCKTAKDIIMTTDDSYNSISTGKEVLDTCREYHISHVRKRRSVLQLETTMLDENSTILQYTPTTTENSKSHLAYIVQKQWIHLHYYEIGVQYKILKSGTNLHQEDVQEEAQAAIMRSILENQQLQIPAELIPGVQAMAVIGDEENAFRTYALEQQISTQNQGFFSHLRLIGMTCFCMTVFIFACICFKANHDEDSRLPTDEREREKKRQEKEFCHIYNEKGVEDMLQIATMEDGSDSSTSEIFYHGRKRSSTSVV